MKDELLEKLRKLRRDISLGDGDDRFEQFIRESINDREDLAREFYFGENAPVSVSKTEYTHNNTADMNKIMIDVVSGFEEFMDRIVKEKNRDYERKKEAATLLKSIMILPMPYCQILYLRYYKCFNWQQVCFIVHMGKTTFYRKHDEAVEMLDQMIGGKDGKDGK
ncbi:MAG: hypothetical protein J5685_06535 [Clostridiales bacterium]|nr:hypothetical protein [Clostridiales bacterium]